MIPPRVRRFYVLLTDSCFLRVFVRLHPVKSFLHFLAVVYTRTPLLVALCAGLAFCLCLSRPCWAVRLFLTVR